jgi:ribosomal protein L37AE/L43A
MGAGIDYGMGHTNINHVTGIRYGVISQHSVVQAWADTSEADYGEPTCPRCGREAIAYDAEKDGGGEGWECAKYECADFMCEVCEYVFGCESAYGEEPQGYSYHGEGYELVDCLDSDIMVIAAPFYTYAPFCSPCVPGAGNLDSARADGVKTYCLGHDWFEGGKAPYRVFDVVYDVEIS